jgi:hypothetical protein
MNVHRSPEVDRNTVDRPWFLTGVAANHYDAVNGANEVATASSIDLSPWFIQRAEAKLSSVRPG